MIGTIYHYSHQGNQVKIGKLANGDYMVLALEGHDGGAVLMPAPNALSMARAILESAGYVECEILGVRGIHLVATREEAPARAECTLPPPGWACTRGAGHPGPCAAVEDEDFREVVDLTAQKPEGPANELFRPWDIPPAPTPPATRDQQEGSPKILWYVLGGLAIGTVIMALANATGWLS